MNIIKINAILTIFIGTTFINIAFAFDGWFSPDKIRCKVEYTRLNLVTGVETIKKHTYQNNDGEDGGDCGMHVPNLSDKIENWLLEDRKNIIVDLSVLYCKKRTDDGIFSNKWSKYKQCDRYDSESLLRWATELKSDLKNQKGYNAHEDRLRELVLD
jgi:hypothetical protein